MKRILHVIPYKHIYPPLNGGHLRSFNLMSQLAQNNIIDVLTYQPYAQIKENGYLNPNIIFYNPNSIDRPKSLLNIFPKKINNALKYRLIKRTLKGPANILVLDFNHILKFLFKNNRYDFVIFEHTSSMQLSSIVKRFMPNTYTILDAHNIDYKLIKNKKESTKVKAIESTLFKRVDSFWACSKSDVEELTAMNQNKIKGHVVPNGVDCENKPFQHDKEGRTKNLLFCGSLDYFPNKEGLIWFFEKVWPTISTEIPDISLTIIGRGNTTPFKSYAKDNRIKLIGEVEKVNPFYQQSYIAIVPLLSGSGTRLKILEAMSFGNPVVTTSIGIEGIIAKHGHHALIADSPDDFARAISRTINTPNLGETLRNNAYQLIRNTYDWNVIGNQINQILSNDQ